MRLGKIFLLGAFLYASIANAQDVMVDLSVLDDLDAPYKNVSKPLFPVLPKKTEAKVEKSLKSKQKKVTKPMKKHKPEKVIEKVKPLEDDIVVVDFEPVSEPVKNTKPAEALAVNETKENVEDVKPAEALVVEDVKPAEASVVEEKKANTEAPKEYSQDVEPKSQLLVSDKEIVLNYSSYIRFDSDADELNDEQKAKIDSIVAGYKNGPKNKIAIYSYNFDDGVDSFKKKRTSLNRAVEVRGYLLKKGYKNFSIKVININNASDKKNMVELQEI